MEDARRSGPSAGDQEVIVAVERYIPLNAGEFGGPPTCGNCGEGRLLIERLDPPDVGFVCYRVQQACTECNYMFRKEYPRDRPVLRLVIRK